MGEVFGIYEGSDELDRFEVRDLRVKTRFAIDNEFYDEFTPVLGTTISMVYVALVRHANKEQKTWPSQSRVAQQLGVNRQWVGVCLQILQMFNLIRSVRVGKTCTNRYYLIDQKHWRRDYEKMLSEVEQAIALQEKNGIKSEKKGRKQVMSTELTSPTVDIRCLRRCQGLLSKLTSNRKDKHKDKQVRREKITVKKATSINKKESDPPKEVFIGKGRKTETTFDPTTNTIVHRRY
ncbi:MAG: helix-turn-helix domain-containing protein [Kiloniellales bacterium]|nr:helix-turn-helix domain-containing protein [Kiloniellales bacterium]